MDTGTQIRRAALRLFARDGFDGTSLQAIADAVGITKQTLLYYHPSKEELRRAVLQELIEHWRDALPALLQAVTNREQRFDALTGELFRFFRTDPDRARLVLRELLDNPQAMRARLLENLRPWVLLIAQHMRRDQERGYLHEDVDAESYVMHVIVLVTTSITSIDVLSQVVSPNEKPDINEKRYFDELFRMARAALFKAQKVRAKRLTAAIKE